MIVGTTPLLVALPLAPKALWMMLKPARTGGNDRVTVTTVTQKEDSTWRPAEVHETCVSAKGQHVAPGRSARDLCQFQRSTSDATSTPQVRACPAS